MFVTVRYFAGHRDITQRSEESIELPTEATVGSLWELLVARYPRLVGYTGRMLYAVNQEYGTLDMALHQGDEVAFIPPVSGGSPDLFHVTSEPLDPAPLVAAVLSADMGAVVTFTGVVRNNFGGRATAYLEYEAFAPMAIKVLSEIASQAQARWGTGVMAIHHRVGKLAIGEVAVLIVVASAHRAAAFEAAAWAMDRIKEIAPIWKREHWADGASEWVGAEKERVPATGAAPAEGQ
jgi:molybdopterin synthase catalytic subunit